MNSALPDDSVLSNAVAFAVRAPSIHNTQPWRFRIGGGRIELHADRSRQLSVADLTGRALLVSCGAALLQARIALQAAGWAVSIQRMPDPADPDHLATVTVSGPAAPDKESRRLVDAAADRRTDRRPFTDRPVDEAAVQSLLVAAAIEDVMMQPVSRRTDRVALIVAVGRADEIEIADPAYLAELRRWSGRPAGSGDGMPQASAPRSRERQSDVKIRDFDVSGPDELRDTRPQQVERAAMFVLATDGDGDAQRLRAGEAVARILLTATSLGLSTSLYTQPLEVAGTVDLLRGILSGFGQPQLVLRVGWPELGTLPPPTGRRALGDVLEPIR